MNTPMKSDIKTARGLLLSGSSISKANESWLIDVIDRCTHDQRKWLRNGLETGPRSLWYDYTEQTWIA